MNLKLNHAGIIASDLPYTMNQLWHSLTTQNQLTIQINSTPPSSGAPLTKMDKLYNSSMGSDLASIIKCGMTLLIHSDCTIEVVECVSNFIPYLTSV